MGADMTEGIRAGLCSVTFRQLSVDELVRAAAQAGLESIEWGAGDGEHLDPHDLDQAAAVGERTRAAGLAVASLGGYFRCRPEEDAGPLLEAAQAAGAPRVRVWAGTNGSADADRAERDRVADVLREVAERAEAHGIHVALEYHGGTLTDTPESARALLQQVDHPNLSTYWQPTQGATDATALAELDAVAAWTSTLHVFSWWPKAERLRLSERAPLWESVFERAASLPQVTDALIEFVPDDDPALLAAEARTLRDWIPRTR